MHSRTCVAVVRETTSYASHTEWADCAHQLGHHGLVGQAGVLVLLVSHPRYRSMGSHMFVGMHLFYRLHPVLRLVLLSVIRTVHP